LNFGQTIWNKIEVLLGKPALENNLGTSRDHDENTLKTRKKNKK
jgi:hypothetical protein